jgi:hypothetical protein
MDKALRYLTETHSQDHKFLRPHLCGWIHSPFVDLSLPLQLFPLRLVQNDGTSKSGLQRGALSIPECLSERLIHRRMERL